MQSLKGWPQCTGAGSCTRVRVANEITKHAGTRQGFGGWGYYARTRPVTVLSCLFINFNVNPAAKGVGEDATG